MLINEKKVCNRCILDSTIPEIIFDSNGICNYCELHERLCYAFPLGVEGKNYLNKLVEKIKFDGRKKNTIVLLDLVEEQIAPTYCIKLKSMD